MAEVLHEIALDCKGVPTDVVSEVIIYRNEVFIQCVNVKK